MRRLWIVAALGATGAAVAATPATAGRPTPASVLAAPSSRISIAFAPASATGVPTGLDEMFSGFTVTGALDYVNHRGRLSYGLVGTTIYDRDATYMSTRQFAPGVDGVSKPWVRFDSAAEDVDVSTDFQDYAERGPVALLTFLLAGSTDVEADGTELIRGTPTTRYRGTFDVETFVAHAPAAERDELSWVLDLTTEGMKAYPFVVWVDRFGVTRRARASETWADFGISTTVDFGAIGAPVDVELPPPDDVMSPDDFSELLNKQIRDTDNGGECSETSETTTLAGAEQTVRECSYSFTLEGEDSGK